MNSLAHSLTAAVTPQTVTEYLVCLVLGRQIRLLSDNKRRGSRGQPAVGGSGGSGAHPLAGHVAFPVPEFLRLLMGRTGSACGGLVGGLGETAHAGACCGKCTVLPPLYTGESLVFPLYRRGNGGQRDPKMPFRELQVSETGSKPRTWGHRSCSGEFRGELGQAHNPWVCLAASILIGQCPCLTDYPIPWLIQSHSGPRMGTTGGWQRLDRTKLEVSESLTGAWLS